MFGSLNTMGTANGIDGLLHFKHCENCVTHEAQYVCGAQGLSQSLTSEVEMIRLLHLISDSFLVVGKCYFPTNKEKKSTVLTNLKLLCIVTE